jgi:hypothetical protein
MMQPLVYDKLLSCGNGKQDNIQMAVERILNEVLLTIDEKQPKSTFRNI